MQKKPVNSSKSFDFAFYSFLNMKNILFSEPTAFERSQPRTVLPNRLKVIVVEAPAAMAVFNDVKLLYIAAVSTDAAAEDDANAVDVTDVLEHLFLVFGSFCGRFRLKMFRWFLWYFSTRILLLFASRLIIGSALCSVLSFPPGISVKFGGGIVCLFVNS